ncbi:uncharacterized protein At1g08160, partial [Carica papaya]|uniref:uncharacterized protein At1g08160 n=1 Tax=Carica papaya TaxID=3649 RepID=UPI000B8CC6B5
NSPPPPPPPPLTPPPARQATPVSLNEIVISKQTAVRRTDPATAKSEKLRQLPLRQPQPNRTNPLIWCGAVLCLIFSLVLIFFGIATLIIFLGIKPRNPVFDAPSASLNSIYFDSPEYFNGDFTFLANFSNPNRKIDVRFEYLDMELYFLDRLIGTQAVQPFSQRRGETRLESLHFISSLVYLPQNLSMELRKQVLNNRIRYNIRGTFKVRASLGMIHFSYWLHGRCQLEMTGPPTGVLVAHSCKTRR